MTKAELLWFLRGFTDDIEIKVSIEGEQLPFRPDYFWDISDPNNAAIILLRVDV